MRVTLEYHHGHVWRVLPGGITKRWNNCLKYTIRSRLPIEQPLDLFNSQVFWRPAIPLAKENGRLSQKSLIQCSNFNADRKSIGSCGGLWSWKKGKRRVKISWNSIAKKLNSAKSEALKWGIDPKTKEETLESSHGKQKNWFTETRTGTGRGGAAESFHH